MCTLPSTPQQGRWFLMSHQHLMLLHESCWLMHHPLLPLSHDHSSYFCNPQGLDKKGIELMWPQGWYNQRMSNAEKPKLESRLSISIHCWPCPPWGPLGLVWAHGCRQPILWMRAQPHCYLLCIPSLLSLSALHEVLTSVPHGTPAAPTGYPFCKSGPPACVAQLIMMRHKVWEAPPTPLATCKLTPHFPAAESGQHAQMPHEHTSPGHTLSQCNLHMPILPCCRIREFTLPQTLIISMLFLFISISFTLRSWHYILSLGYCW